MEFGIVFIDFFVIFFECFDIFVEYFEFFVILKKKQEIGLLICNCLGYFLVVFLVGFFVEFVFLRL